MKLVFALLAGTALLGCQESAPLPVADDVQLGRFQGRWYEIASLPRASQAGCTGTTADYSLTSERELLIVNECRQGALDGPLLRMAARAVVSDPEVPAKLSLDFGWGYGDYWILEVGPDYQYAVVGHPTRDYLWILSRAPTLSAQALDAALARAREQGFATALLRFTQH
jgi:apolipoprotein D and lipocalin family protein